MIVTKLYSIPDSFIEQVKDGLGAEYDLVVEDIKEGRSELYLFGNSLTCFYTNKTQVQIVFLIGENLRLFTQVVIEKLKGVGIKEVVIHTKRNGMIRHMERLGAKHTGTYQVYKLEL